MVPSESAFMLKGQKAKMVVVILNFVCICFCFSEDLGIEAPHFCIFIHVLKSTTSLSVFSTEIESLDLIFSNLNYIQQ